MNFPTVSIIIPIYNSDETLEKCLNGVLSQKFDDWECVLVNDGSTDTSEHICKKFVNRDSRFRYIKKENGGVSSARNIGLDSINGKWVCFIDSDDFISADYLHPSDYDTDAELVLKSVIFSNKQEEYDYIPPSVIMGRSLKTFLEDHLYSSKLLTPWAKIYRRNIIEQERLRFNTSFKLGEDTLFVDAYLKYVNAIVVSGHGHYFYTFTLYNKYHFPVRKAIEYMQVFSPIFFDLGLQCPEMAKRMLIWYSGFTSDFHGKNKILWYTDKAVNKLYRHAYSHFPIAMKIKIIIYTILTFIRR